MRAESGGGIPGTDGGEGRSAAEILRGRIKQARGLL